MKKKVIEFLGALNDGGAETLVKDYALLLNKEEFEVSVVVLWETPNTSNYQILKENGIRILPLFEDASLYSKIMYKYFKNTYIPWKLNKVIQKEKPNVIHIHYALLRYVSTIRNRIRGIKLVYTCHNVPERYFSGKFINEKKAAMELIHDNDLQLVALHKEMANELAQIFDLDNVVIVNNGPDFQRFEQLSETKEEIRHSMGIDNDAFVVGHVGRFTEQKNHLFLLDVFREILKINKNSILLLVGDGKNKDDFERVIQENNLSARVHILSHRNDVPRILKAMDVFVFPSLFEGLSVALVEAQVAGLRCVISDTINEDSILTEQTVPLNLSDSPEKWASVCLDRSVVNPQHGVLEDYNLRKSIHCLESIYKSK